jgi:hypothetical protein
MEILLKNIPSNGNSCVLYDCKDCGLSGAPDCQEMADFLGKKKRETFEEQENTEIEALERQVERLEKRIEELERMHYTQPPSPLIIQPYPWTPEDPSYPFITCSGESVSDVETFLSETRDG